MSTVETHVIGVGTTDPAGYTTIAAWLAACPANLVTADLIWRGELMNQGFAAATKTGITADATHYVELTTAAGCSFLDNADVRTNPLRFNKSVGAYIEGTASYTAALSIGALYTRISKLQVNHTSGYSNDVLSLGSYSRVSACICEGRRLPLRIASAGIVENSFFLQRYTAALAVAVLPSATIVNSTFVAGAFTSPYAISGNYVVGSIKNCYFGNCTLTTATGTLATTWTKSNNASSVVIDGCVTAPLSTATFEDVTYGTHDFRLAAGSALIDAGVADGTYGLNDITGLLRVDPWDIGAWEADTAAGGSLAASASGSATAAGTAALAAQVALAAVGVALAGGAATAIASVPLSAAGIAVSGGTANGAATVTISAAGLATAAGQAGLSASVLLAAAGAARSAGNATLAAQLAAMATGAAQSGGSATLSGGAPGALSASGGASAGGSAVLKVAVQLVAAGGASAGGSASLAGGAPGAISASGGATAGGSALTSVTVNLTAAGFVQAMGAGQMIVQVGLAANGRAQSGGHAVLANGQAVLTTPECRLIVIGADRRRAAVPYQNRRARA